MQRRAESERSTEDLFSLLVGQPSEGHDEVAVATRGVHGASETLPHVDRIAESFGPEHEATVRGARARVGGEAAVAARAIGAEAYATGSSVGFAGAPDLHTAAHEAAHVVQQRAGVHLKGGVGVAGDAYERHADAVADRVVSGRSASDLLCGPTGAASGDASVQRKEEPSAAPAAAAAGSDHVTTTWFVDYNVPGGKTKGLPERKGDDQMIVDQLKIDSHNREPMDKPVILHGGDMAHAGRAYLGTASVPKGPGDVSAAVRYAKRSDFSVTISLDPPPKDRATKDLLRTAQADATTFVLGEIESRGDYDQIAKDAEAQLAPRFPDRTVTVSVKPVGARSKVSEQLSAQAAEFDAQTDSTYVALIDPSGTQDTSVGWTASEGSEEGGGESDEAGAKTTADVGTSAKVSEKEKLVTSFQSTLKTNVQDVFKNLQEQIDADTTTNAKHYDHSVKWTVGIDPAKEKKDGEGDEKKSDGGLVDEVKGTVSTGASWLYRKGRDLLKQTPLVKDLLQIGGTLWDGITARGEISRESTETDGHTDTSSHSGTHKSGTEIDSLKDIATELTNQMIRETEHAVDKEISTKLGVEISTTKKTDTAHKKQVNRGNSGTVVTHEVGKPQVLIKKIK